MAFLTLDELGQYIPPALADVIAGDPGVFDVAERSAAATVTEITGVEPPDDPTTAEQWVKSTVAALILFDRIGAYDASPQQIAWARTMRDNAMSTLERHQPGAATGIAAPEVFTIDGLFTDEL